MADKLNGRFKLITATNVDSFYKAAGISQAEIDKYADFDNPEKGLEIVQNTAGDDYSIDYILGGKKVFEEKYKLGVARDTQMDDIKYNIKTTLEGDKLIDITTRPGIKQTRYERYMDGDKLIVVMTAEGIDIKSTREFTRI